MATVKGLYDLIKKEQAEGKKLNPFFQAIVDAYEADVSQTTKEVSATFIKKKNGGDNGNS